MNATIDTNETGMVRSPSRRRLLRTSTVPARRLWLLLSSSPVRASLYMWTGGVWVWLILKVLSDQYPAFTALIH